MNTSPWTIRRLHSVDADTVSQLASVLVDCVEGGASVSFMAPLGRERAEAFWTRVAHDVANGERAILVAQDDNGICGTVQLILAQPDNQPHRADLSKMLVHSRARKQGLGAALLRAAEQMGRDSGKTLLVLDAVTGGDGERLYTNCGWQRVGVVPNFALLPHGGFCDTTFFYRRLDA
ncbi:MAG: GNAT family N-acetyltransferase [Gemmatimonadaceae bacterium]